MEIRKIRIALLSILVMFLAFAPLFIAPITQVGATPFRFASHNSTYVGPASRALIAGPLKVTPSLVKPSLVKPSNSIPHQSWIPAHGFGYNPRPSTLPKALPPPAVNCAPQAAGCDTISLSLGGATSSLSVGTLGLNGVDTGATVGVDVEPPDGPLCVGNGYVMNVLNIGELRVYNTNLTPASADITLDNLMGLTTLGWSSGGDPSCLYDYDNGGHWFITEIVSTTPESIGGTFAGCFAALEDACREGIAVSVTNNPTGAYNIYFVDPNIVNPTDPGVGSFLNDFAKIATTRDAFLMFYDEFPLNGNPGFGEFFNGAQELAFSKKALELGFPVLTPFNAPSPGAPNPFFNVAIENMGTDPAIQPPDGTCIGSGGIDCWYQVIPAQSPDPTQFDNTHGGTGYMLANLDFASFAFGTTQGDNRIAEFQWTGLSNLNSFGCGTCSGIGFGGTLFTNVQSYVANQGPPWTLAPQKAGPIPLGDTQYPVVDTIGGTAHSSAENGAVYASEVTASFGGTLQSVGIQLSSFPFGTHISAAIYTNTGSNTPGTLLAQSASFACTTPTGCAAGFYDLTTPSVALTTGTSYWLAFQTDSFAISVDYNTGTSYKVSQAFGSFPNSPTWVAGPASTFSLRMSHLGTPEGEIQANGDGFTQVSYAQGQLWGAISTLITQKYLSPSGADEVHVGSAYFVVGTSSFDAGSPTTTLTDQAYVTAKHEDLVFPSMAAGGTPSQDGGPADMRAIIAFTLTGNGGPTGADHGGFYPSTAYGRLSKNSHGLIGKVINVADLGMSPQDGFSEYQNFNTPHSLSFYRPRWGDYTWAIFLPNSGGKIYFETEYIQSPNCSDSQFLVDPSCGGTRDKFINWGSSLNYVTP